MSTGGPSNVSPRRAGSRPPPLLLPISASALSSPSSLSLASPVSPSFSSSRNKTRNAKQLSLAVPSLQVSNNLSTSNLSASRLRPSTSHQTYAGSSSGPLSPNSSCDSDALDLSETRSCPPTPRLVLDTDNVEETVLNAADRGELKSSLRGDVSMRRRTSLPRLKIVSNTPASVNEHAVPPTPSVARPKTGVPALTVESLVARNKEAGEPLDKDSKDAEEEFPYQFGPKEILPGLFLGSEQNAKDPAILSRLGITQVICCAKEVSCPWLAEEISSDDDPHGMSSARQISAGSNSSLLSPDMCSSPSQPLPEHPASTLPTSPPFNVSRTSSPSRPAFLRPAVSTPNLKEKKRGKPLSPLRNDVPLPISPEQMLPTASFRAATSHSGYLHRYFPANRSSGRPALQYTKLPWGHDEDDIARHFETYQICEMVDRARRDGGRCLVHCQLGVSRSATLMIGYCMRQAFCNQDASLLQEVKTMHDSYTYVRSKSRWVAPNIGLLAQLVQYERVLTAENMPNQPLPYSNSAYYDSQLSLPNMQGSRTPDNLSPSSTSESEEDSHLTTPEFGSDLVSAAQEERKYMQVDALNRSAHKKTLGVEDPARLSPMTAALGLARPADPLPRLVLEKVTFGSAQRKREHRKTFSADFSKLPLAFTKHHDNA